MQSADKSTLNISYFPYQWEYVSYISLGNLEDATDTKVNYAEIDLLSGGQDIYCFTIRLAHKICTTDLQ